MNLTGWKLTDEGAKHLYTFSGTPMPAGGSWSMNSGEADGGNTGNRY